MKKWLTIALVCLLLSLTSGTAFADYPAKVEQLAEERERLANAEDEPSRAALRAKLEHGWRARHG